MHRQFIARLTLYLMGSLLLFLVAASLLAPLASAHQAFSPAQATPAAQATPTTQAVTCAQLAPGENPLTLPDARLLALGLPTQNSIRHDLAYWKKVFAHLGRHMCGQGQAIDLHQEVTGMHSANTSPAPASSGLCLQPGTVCAQTLWAGDETISPVGDGARGLYNESDLTITVPSISQSPSTAKLGIWTGLGGNGVVTNPWVVVQAGILLQPGQPNEAIIDVEPTMHGAQLRPLCRVATGDTITIHVESNLGDDGFDYFFMQNQTAGGCNDGCFIHTTDDAYPDTCGDFTGGPAFTSDGATGECIVERVGGTPLAQFNPPSNTIQMQYCQVNSSPLGEPGEQSVSFNYLYLCNSSGQVLASGSSPDINGTFNIPWNQGS